MKVVYVLNSTYALGGASKSFVTMVRGLMEKGITPVVVAPDNGGICAQLADMGVEVMVSTYRINTYPLVRSWRDALLFLPRLVARRVVNARAVARLHASLAGQGVALVHTNVSVVDIGYRLSRKLGVPHIYHIREFGNLDFGEAYYPSWAMFHRSLSAPRCHVVCITHCIMAHHGLRSCPRARVIYNGISVASGCDAPACKQGYYLYAGRLEQAKGLDMLLQGYAHYLRASQTKAPLWIAGDGEPAYKHRLMQAAMELGLEGHVRFLGARHDVGTLMQEARAVIVASRMEAFGRCLAEAMLCRTLTVGYNTGGTKEQFDNGLRLTGAEIGIRFASAHELGQALCHVDAMPAHEQSAMAERAHHTVSTLYSPQANISAIYDYYRDILNENAH